MWTRPEAAPPPSRAEPIAPTCFIWNPAAPWALLQAIWTTMYSALGVGTGRAGPKIEGTGPDPSINTTGRGGAGFGFFKIGSGPNPALLKRAGSYGSPRVQIFHSRLKFGGLSSSFSSFEDSLLRTTSLSTVPSKQPPQDLHSPSNNIVIGGSIKTTTTRSALSRQIRD